MPTAEVELNHRNEAIDWVLEVGNAEEHFWVAHEASEKGGLSQRGSHKGGGEASGVAHLVILSSMLRGSRMKVGRTTRLRSAPGRSWDMMCMSTTLLA